MRRKYFIFIDVILLVSVIILLAYKWFSLGFSEYEMASGMARIWDIKNQILCLHHFPSWTQFFMCGTSYTLMAMAGLPTFLSLLFSFFFNLETALKLVIIIALLGSALMMYGFIWTLFKNRAAALIAAIVYSLHPIQMDHAPKWEHATITLTYCFAPLLFLLFIKAFQTKSVRYVVFSSFALMAALGSSAEQALIILLFMFFFCIFVSLWSYKKEKLFANIKIYLLILLAALALGAFFIVPVRIETNYYKLFLGDPLAGWRQTYSLKNIFFFFNRDGLLLNPILKYLHPVLRFASADKYFGIIPFILIITTFFVRKKKEHRMFFWFGVSSFLLSVMAASGVFSIFGINFVTLRSLMKNAPFLQALPVYFILFAIILILSTFLYKIRANPKKIILFLGFLAAFLFLKLFWFIQRLPIFNHMRCPYWFLDIVGVFFFAFLCSFFALEVLSKIRKRWIYHLAAYSLFALIIFDYFPYTKYFRQNNVLPSTRENLKTTYQTIGKDPENIKVYFISSHYYNMLGPMYSGKPLVYENGAPFMSAKGLGALFVNSHDFNLRKEFLNLTSTKYIVIEKADKNTYESIKRSGLLVAYQKIYPTFLENDSFLVLENPRYKSYIQGYNSKALYIGDYVQSGKLALFLSAKNVVLIQGKFNALCDYPFNYLDSFDYIFYNKPYGEDTDYLLRVEDRFRDKFYDLTAQPYLNIKDAKQTNFENVKITRISSEEIKIQLTASQDSILMLSESYFPYWHVWINGEKRKAAQVNCGFMGVEVKHGVNELVFRYVNPWYYKIAYLISIVAFIVMIVLLKKPSLVQKSANTF